jgi:L-ribulose-5-phosphate 4-epimerase
MTLDFSADRLMPALTPREELVLLARTLWREGYSDHLAGHITYDLGDGTLLCNPWLVLWNELLPQHVIRIDMSGRVVEGEWPAPLGIPLHLALHEARPGVAWAMHNHPAYGTVMADMKIVPPPMDQSSSLGGGDLVLVDEYDGPVNGTDNARATVAAMGDAELALLAGHGVFVLGSTAAAVFLRAVALEQRCQRAWQVLAAGRPLDSPLSPAWLETIRRSDGTGFVGFWEAMVRAELRADPELLAALEST